MLQGLSECTEYDAESYPGSKAVPQSCASLRDVCDEIEATKQQVKKLEQILADARVRQAFAPLAFAAAAFGNRQKHHRWP